MNADYADRRQYAVGRDRQIFIAMELLFLYLRNLCNLRLISFLRGERLPFFQSNHELRRSGTRPSENRKTQLPGIPVKASTVGSYTVQPPHRRAPRITLVPAVPARLRRVVMA